MKPTCTALVSQLISAERSSGSCRSVTAALNENHSELPKDENMDFESGLHTDNYNNSLLIQVIHTQADSLGTRRVVDKNQ
jgi:hypothetical protein